MTTFYDVIKRVARQIADARTGVATGGSTTTLIDTLMDGPDEYYNNGLLFIDHTVPVIVKVTDYDLATHTFTFATSTVVAAGKKYTVIDERFPLDVLKQAINQALVEDIGQIMGIDESLVPAEGQERYALPADVYDIRRVEIGEEDSSWDINYAWSEELGELRFQGNLPSVDQTIRVHYVHTHEEMIDLDDVIDDQVPLDLLIHAASVYALQWRMVKVRENEPGLKDKFLFNETRAIIARSKGKKQLLNRDPILSRW